MANRKVLVIDDYWGIVKTTIEKEGSYTLRHDYIDKKEVTYKWSQDYLD